MLLNLAEKHHSGEENVKGLFVILFEGTRDVALLSTTYPNKLHSRMNGRRPLESVKCTKLFIHFHGHPSVLLQRSWRIIFRPPSAQHAYQLPPWIASPAGHVKRFESPGFRVSNRSSDINSRCIHFPTCHPGTECTFCWQFNPLLTHEPRKHRSTYLKQSRGRMKGGIHASCLTHLPCQSSFSLVFGF